jgi:4-cresol dehydrogenase (hydroxylating)
MNPAIEAWRNVLGEARVDASDATLDRYARSTQPCAPRETRPCCVLYPTTTAEVQAVVRVAGEHRAPVYPLSRGKNWGYSDACAAIPGTAIVDLSRMNRIVEVNTELAYAVIEPGVSQGQLYRYLVDNKTGLWMDCTGAGPDASLVGNTLDRGFGHTRYGDHFLTTCGMEIVLADGRVLNTGYGHYANARAHRVYRYGVGPALDGLFCQSNIGIVTRIGLWLMPEPEAFCFYFTKVDRPEDLAPLVDRLRPLRLNGVITSALHIGNDLRVLSGRRAYPWDETGGVAPLPPEVRARLCAAGGIGAWNAGGALTGTAAHVRASRRALKAALRGFARVGFLDDTRLALARKVVRILQTFGRGARFSEMLAALDPVYATLKGEPTRDALRGSLWRVKHKAATDSGDPLDHGAGLMWLSPALPATGKDAQRVTAIAGPFFARYGFDLLATFTMINERAMVAILNVAFDQADVEESGRAEACYHDAMNALVREGYPPYRVGLGGFGMIADPDDTFWQVATALKRALDPNDIIAPGRYIPRL